MKLGPGRGRPVGSLQSRGLPDRPLAVGKLFIEMDPSLRAMTPASGAGAGTQARAMTAHG
jgi:hypothetical protein